MLKKGSMYEFDLPRNDRNSRVKFALKDHVQTVPSLGGLSFELRGLRVFETLIPS